MTQETHDLDEAYDRALRVAHERHHEVDGFRRCADGFEAAAEDRHPPFGATWSRGPSPSAAFRNLAAVLERSVPPSKGA